MSESRVWARRFGPETIRRVFTWHPEWWVIGLSGVAWYFIFLPPGSPGIEICGISHASVALGTLEEWTRGLVGWLIMVVAMMLPLTLFPIRATAFNSLWRRRHWAIGTFLTSYVAVWMVTGTLVLRLVEHCHGFSVQTLSWLVAGGLLALSGWQLTSSKQGLAVACHQTMPLAPSGWKAHRSCLQFGASQGVYCVANCGPLMALSVISPWHQTMMIAATSLLFAERYQTRPRHRAIALALGGFALAHVLAAGR